MSTQYAADDVRSKLAVAAPTVQVDPSTPIKPSQWIEFLALSPTETGERGSRTWLARSATLVIAYTEAKAGEVFARAGHPDEYAILQYSGSAPIRVTTNWRGSMNENDIFLLPFAPPNGAMPLPMQGACQFEITV